MLTQKITSVFNGAWSTFLECAEKRQLPYKRYSNMKTEPSDSGKYANVNIFFIELNMKLYMRQKKIR